MNNDTAAQAWDRLVGSQTPEEFMNFSSTRDIWQAVADYAAETRYISDDEQSQLVEYIRSAINA